MPNELSPIVDQWYWHHDKGPVFYVTAVDDEERTIEVQHYDGDVEEITFAEWRTLNLAPGEEPENWSGSMDIDETDDLGTEVTDTRRSDWDEPLSDYHEDTEANTSVRSDGPNDDYGEGHMEEIPLDGGDENITGTGPIDISNVLQREDGVYEETLNESWYAEYSEDDESGLWRADLYKRDVPEWREDGFESLEEAVLAARDYYAQT